jgi:hypothetical protein
MNVNVFFKDDSGKIRVSDTLVQAYRLFPVDSVGYLVDRLERVEKILLFLLIAENYSDYNEACIQNFKPYDDILGQVLEWLENESGTFNDRDILFLHEITGSKTINLNLFVDSRGMKLPKALDDKEIKILRRDSRIEKILEKDPQ